MSPRLLDLYCGAGGASEGYARAGFEVQGVDLHPMPRHPHNFIQANALDVLADLDFCRSFDVIHASPPCQAYTPLGALHPGKTYPDLVSATRDLLDVVGRPYVIENVMSAPLIKERSVTLCGGMFGLRTYRHRRFESNVHNSAHPRTRSTSFAPPLSTGVNGGPTGGTSPSPVMSEPISAPRRWGSTG